MSGEGPERLTNARRMKWMLRSIILCLLGALAVLSWVWLDAVDPFCRRGYIAYDGSCAWE